jgi:DHA2 family multidrug resistance protein
MLAQVWGVVSIRTSASATSVGWTDHCSPSKRRVNTLLVLIFFRILQAVGGAFLFPLAVTQLYQAFPLEERGLAGGVFGVAALLAPAVGPVLGGYFITYASWPLIFYINIPVGLLGLLLGSVLLREVPSAGRSAALHQWPLPLQ